MEHVVFYSAPEGPAFRRVASLAEAVAVVERLRNDLGVQELSVHALTEVPMSFRAYYRVEVPGSDEPLATVPHQGGPLDVTPQPRPEDVAPVEAAAPAVTVEPASAEVTVEPAPAEPAPAEPAPVAPVGVPLAVAPAAELPHPQAADEPVVPAATEAADDRPLVMADAPAAPTVLPEVSAAVGDPHRPRGLGRFVR